MATVIKGATFPARCHQCFLKPFDQMSNEIQTLTSLAPKLKIKLLRQGSLLPRQGSPVAFKGVIDLAPNHHHLSKYAK